MKKIFILILAVISLTLSCDRFSTLSYNEWIVQGANIYLNFYSSTKIFQTSVKMDNNNGTWKASSPFVSGGSTYFEFENKSTGVKWSAVTDTLMSTFTTSPYNYNTIAQSSNVPSLYFSGNPMSSPMTYEFNSSSLAVYIHY